MAVEMTVEQATDALQTLLAPATATSTRATSSANVNELLASADPPVLPQPACATHHQRDVTWEEVKAFREVGACGTATVVAPIASITDGDVKHEWHKHEVLTSLREHLQQVQLGEAEDKHGWMREVQM